MSEKPASRLALVSAFAAVYVIWGSTYLAIRACLETLPPFLMAGVRFVLAGLLMLAWRRLAGDPAPRREHWLAALVTGGLMLGCGNGGVVWAQQTLPSGLTALIVASVPAWMALMGWLRPGGTRPPGRVAAGIVLGFLGVAVLVAPFGQGADAIAPSALVVVLGSAGWAAGSLLARGMSLPRSLLLTSAMQMAAGGVVLLLAGLVAGEVEQVRLDQVSARSAIAFLYLLVFGSLVAFSCYAWLLRVTTPARASTYAYVNPVVAVALGTTLAGEQLTARLVLGAAVIIGAVVLITSAGVTPPTPKAA